MKNIDRIKFLYICNQANIHMIVWMSGYPIWKSMKGLINLSEPNYLTSKGILPGGGRSYV